MNFNNTKNKNKPVILITGCASGLGLELAKKLKKIDKYNVVATCRERRLDDLKNLLGETTNFRVRELDITNDKNIYQLIHDVCAEWGRIDVIINNAAVCYRGVVEHMDSDSEMMQLKTNYLGPMSLIRAVLPIMREQRSGQIINVSSVSGLVAMPTMGSYSASKHALEGSTEALWYEARPFGISVHLVELGFIKSESFKNVVLSNKAQMSLSVKGPHSEYYTSMAPFIEKLMPLSLTSAQDVASKICEMITNKPAYLRIKATPDVLLFAILKGVLPSSLLNRLFFWMLPGSVRWGGRWKHVKLEKNLNTTKKAV